MLRSFLRLGSVAREREGGKPIFTCIKFICGTPKAPVRSGRCGTPRMADGYISFSLSLSLSLSFSHTRFYFGGSFFFPLLDLRIFLQFIPTRLPILDCFHAIFSFLSFCFSLCPLIALLLLALLLLRLYRFCYLSIETRSPSFPKYVRSILYSPSLPH